VRIKIAKLLIDNVIDIKISQNNIAINNFPKVEEREIKMLNIS